MQSITQEWRFQVFYVHQMEYPVGWAVFVSHPFSEWICHLIHTDPERCLWEGKGPPSSTPKEMHTKASCKNVAFLFQGFSPVQWRAEPSSPWPVLLSSCVGLWFHDLISFHCCFLQLGFYRQLPPSVQRST